MSPNTVIFGIMAAMILGTIAGLLLGMGLCRAAAKKVPVLTVRKVQDIRANMDNPAGAAPTRRPSASVDMFEVYYPEEQ